MFVELGKTHSSPLAYAHFAQCLLSEGAGGNGEEGALWGHRMSLLKVMGVPFPPFPPFLHHFTQLSGEL